MLLLSQSFLEAVARLPASRLKRIPKFVQMISANRTAPSLHIERIEGCPFCSARLDLDYRGILGEHPQGIALLHVDKHDDAYSWAHRHAATTSHAARYPYEPSATPASPKIEAQPRDAYRAVQRPRSASETPTDEPGLTVGSIHSWAQLAARFRWDTDKPGYYLRERDGGIVCACLRADMNPNAPWEILVGTKPENIRQAELLAKETKPIPVFVKEAVDQWEYWGDFLFDHFETDRNEILPRLPESRRDDTARIAFLRDADAGTAIGTE